MDKVIGVPGHLNPELVMHDGTPADILAAAAACHRQASPRFLLVRDAKSPATLPFTPSNPSNLHSNLHSNLFALRD